MTNSPCSICEQEFPIDDLVAFRRHLDEEADLELWCHGCLIPYMQEELDLADMLTLQYTQILGTIAKELSANPMSEGNNAALYLIREALRAKPARQKHLDRLIALLVARMNYSEGKQREVLTFEFGWRHTGLGGCYHKTIVTINHDTQEKEQKEVEAVGAVAALEHDIRKIVEEILGEQIWSATRAQF